MDSLVYIITTKIGRTHPARYNQKTAIGTGNACIAKEIDNNTKYTITKESPHLLAQGTPAAASHLCSYVSEVSHSSDHYKQQAVQMDNPEHQQNIVGIDRHANDVMKLDEQRQWSAHQIGMRRVCSKRGVCCGSPTAAIHTRVCIPSVHTDTSCTGVSNEARGSAQTHRIHVKT